MNYSHADMIADDLRTYKDETARVIVYLLAVQQREIIFDLEEYLEMPAYARIEAEEAMRSYGFGKVAIS